MFKKISVMLILAFMLGLTFPKPINNNRIKYIPLVKIFNLKSPIIKSVVTEKNTNTKTNTKTKTETKTRIFTVTAYDLSFQSTQKSRSDPSYGLTSTGFNLKGKSRLSAKTIAVDKRIIPINSKVKLTFLDNKYQMYNGVYHCRDVGGGIRGKHIDLFIGDDPISKQKAIEFGVTKCRLEIIKENE